MASTTAPPIPGVPWCDDRATNVNTLDDYQVGADALLDQLDQLNFKPRGMLHNVT